MVKISTELNKKSVKDLQPNENTSKGSNLIEPTEAMINKVVEKLRNNDSYKSIKKTIKKKGTNLTLSYGQIKEIEIVWKNTLKVKTDETGLLVLSEDGMTINRKCPKCKKYPCECK